MVFFVFLYLSYIPITFMNMIYNVKCNKNKALEQKNVESYPRLSLDYISILVANRFYTIPRIIKKRGMQSHFYYRLLIEGKRKIQLLRFFIMIQLFNVRFVNFSKKIKTLLRMIRNMAFGFINSISQIRISIL